MSPRTIAILTTLILAPLAIAANVIISPNMGMPVPVVGTDPGPDWANNINASLSIIDSHDHTAGHGVQVPTSGLNINSDLSFQSNNATTLRSTRFTAQNSPISGGSDLGALYVSGADLYYNDEAGNQVRITQGGSVTGSTGTITGLPSGTASASYAAGTFAFQSATNTPANMAVGPLVIGTNTVSPHTVTVAPPGGLSANYNLTLPNGLPGSTSLLTVDNSGNMASSLAPPTLTSLTTNSLIVHGNTTIDSGDIIRPSSDAVTALSISNAGGSTPYIMSFDTTHNRVGINTNTPATALDVRGNVTIGNTNVILPASDSVAALGITNTAGSSPYIMSFDTTNNRVGVNKNAPTVALDVVGAITSSGNMVAGGSINAGTSMTASGTGGNVPHACTKRSTTGSITATITCSAGEIVTGGGCNPGASANVTGSYPDTTTSWVCTGNLVQTVTAYAICCSI